MRTISRTVVFTRPFTLAGFNGTQPAGSYVVETDVPKDASDPTWRRRSTVRPLHPKPGAAQSATVCSAELAAALLQDGAATALRFESCVQQAHRDHKKRIFFETVASWRIVESGAPESDADR